VLTFALPHDRSKIPKQGLKAALFVVKLHAVSGRENLDCTKEGMESHRCSIHFFVFLLCLAVTTGSLDARIVAASGGNRPAIKEAGNGTPVVQITKPDKHGISEDNFSEFNIGQRGVVFNNNFLPSRTPFAGLVKHNPNLSWGDYARLIIAKVVGGFPSNLDGPIEIAGQRADLVLANPNGINANGVRVYNVSRLTLAAGNIQNGAGGDFTLSTCSGYVRIGSGGLNVLTINDVTVIGRNILLDGPVQAGLLLQVLSGERFYDYKTRVSTRTGKKGEGWGIDAQVLGAMNAGQIILQSTDQGVGVRIKSKLAASAGDVMITANGRIRLKGSIRSNGRVIVRSTAGKIKDSGRTIASGAVIYDAGAGLETTGLIESGSYLQFAAGTGDWTNSGTLLTNGALLVGGDCAGVNRGEIDAAKGVAAQLLTARNLGEIESQGTVTIQTSGDLTNSGRIIGDQGIALIAQSGALTQSGWIESAAGNVLEFSGGSLEQTGLTLTSGRAILNAASNLTAGGSVVANGGLNLIGGGSTTLEGTIATQGDLVAAAGHGDLTSRAALSAGGTLELDSTGALVAMAPVVSGKNLYLNAQSVALAKGAASGGGLEITASSGDITTGALLAACQNLILTAAEKVTLHGGLDAGGDIGIESGGNLSDDGQWIAAGQLAVIADQGLDQSAGLSASKAAIQVGRDARLGGLIQTGQSFGVWVGGNLLNAARIDAGGSIGLNVQGDLTNSGALRSAQTIELTTGGALANSGAITAVAEARLEAEGSITNSGQVQSGNGILIQSATGDLTNSGQLQSLSDIVIRARGSLFNSGLILSNTNVELDAVTTLINTGAAQVGGVLSFLSTGTISNTANLEAANGLELVTQNGSITSTGSLSSGDGLQFQAGGDLLVQGDLSAQTDLLAHAGGSLALYGTANLGGKADIAANQSVLLNDALVAGNDVQIISANGALNTSGSIETSHGIALGAGTNVANIASLSAGTDIAIAGGTGVATLAEIVAEHNVAISSGTGITTNLGTIEAGNILGIEGAGLANTNGLLHSFGDLTIGVTGAVDNSSGTIEAGRNINIHSGDYTGAGGAIRSGFDTVIDSSGDWNNNSGIVEAGRSLQFQAQSGSNVSGSMTAGSSALLGDLLMDVTGAFDNTDGTLSGARHVLIDAGGAFTDNSGRITSGAGDLVWQVGGPLANGGATITVGRNFELVVSHGNTFDNTGGQIAVKEDSELAVSGAFINTNGTITTGNNLALTAGGDLNNVGGTIRAGTDIATFTVNGNAENAGGIIAAGGLFQGAIAQTFTQAGTLTANGQIQLYAGTLDNAGSILTQVLALKGGTLTNSGTILADLGVDAEFNLVTLVQGSTIESLSGPVQMVADQGTFTNAGTIASGQNIVLQANGGGLTNSGQVLAANDLSIVTAGQLTNTGTVSAGKDLAVDAGSSEILNQGGKFLAGNDARFDAGSLVNTTSGGETDSGWQHYAVIYPDGTGIGKGLPGGVVTSHGYYGELALMLNYIRTIDYTGTPGIVSAGNDLVINTINGGQNQASQIVAGGTVSLTGSWQNVGNGTYFGRNWLLVYQEAEHANGDTDSLDHNDRYRPDGVKGGDKNAETDIALIGNNWYKASNFWDYINSSYFAWNPATSPVTQSPWIDKDALYPGRIDGMSAHDFFGVADSLRLKFVVTSTPPANDARHLNFNDVLGTPAVIEGFGGTNVNVQDNGIGVSDVGTGGKLVSPVLPTLESAKVGPVAEPVAKLAPAPALTNVPQLEPSSIPLGLAPPKIVSVAGPSLDASNLGLNGVSIPQAPAYSAISAESSIKPFFAVAVTCLLPAGFQSRSIQSAAGLAPIRANVQLIAGQDFPIQVTIDQSPELQFVDFDSYWTPPNQAQIALSPELQNLLARNPIPDHSPFKALDHLFGKVFTDSALLDWAHDLKPALDATDPGTSLFAGVHGLGLSSGYPSRADWLSGLKAADPAEKVKGLFTSASLLAGLNGVALHGVNIQRIGSAPDFIALVKSHQAWIAKNFPGFYSWQHKVEKQVQKKIDAENSNGGLLQIVGIVVAAVVAIVLTVVTYGAFASVGATILGSLTTTGAAAFTAGTAVSVGAVTAATVVGASVIGGGIGFASGFLSTFIATGGNFRQALVVGGIGALAGAVTAGIIKIPIVQSVVSYVSNAVAPAFTLAAQSAGQALSEATQFVGDLVSKAVGDSLTMALDKVAYGQSMSGANFLVGLGLLAGTALSATFIGHFAPLQSLWNSGPSFSVGGGTITLTQELVKPEVEGVAAYGIGEALGVQDPSGLGIGTTVGSFAAPWVQAGTTNLFGNDTQFGTSFYQPGIPGYASSTADGVNSQITGLLGGVVSYASGHDFSLGQFGGTVVYQHNDQLEQEITAGKSLGDRMIEEGYLPGDPGSGELQIGINKAAPATAQALGVRLSDAQQALDNLRAVNNLGDVSQVPYVVMSDGEVYGPGGNGYLGNLKDYLPAPQEVVSADIAVDPSGNQLALTVGNEPQSGAVVVTGDGSSVWGLGNFARGKTIEEGLGMNVGGNFPVIDDFNFDTGVVTSLKSLDLGAATYQNPSILTTKLNGYIDSVANFSGAKWGGINIDASDITGRQLQLAVPGGTIAPFQQSVIDAATQNAASNGVKLIVTPAH
jgi:filamentous hemagglutinin family protein